MKTSVPKIETARLVLRPLSASDLDEWTGRIFADSDVMRYMPKGSVTPRERAERFLKHVSENWARYGYGEWAVTDKADGRFIGHCGLNYVDEAGEVEIDYALAKPYWRKGIMTEAARASVRFGFENARLERIIALVMHENIASRRVAEHVGFTYEKDAHYFGLDLVYYVLACERFQTDDSPYLVRASASS